jgi:hypothetical protein
MTVESSVRGARDTTLVHDTGLKETLRDKTGRA